MQQWPICVTWLFTKTLIFHLPNRYGRRCSETRLTVLKRTSVFALYLNCSCNSKAVFHRLIKAKRMSDSQTSAPPGPVFTHLDQLVIGRYCRNHSKTGKDGESKHFSEGSSTLLLTFYDANHSQNVNGSFKPYVNIFSNFHNALPTWRNNVTGIRNTMPYICSGAFHSWVGPSGYKSRGRKDQNARLVSFHQDKETTVPKEKWGKRHMR